MKNSNFIFTRTRKGLANGVWLCMLITLICSALLLSFKLITHVDCSSFEIYTSGLRQQTNNIFYVGETITFSIPATSKDNIKWNFGDGTTEQTGKNIIQHSFLKEDDFYVTCTLNSKCQQTIVINIISTPSKPKDTTQFLGIPIIGMDTVNAGTIVHFSTLIKANYSYQWSLSGSPDIKTTPGADFSFYKEGLQMLTLKIDGNKTYTKTIVVLAKKSSSNISTPNAGTGILPTKPFAIPPAIASVYPLSGGPGTIVTITGSFLGGTKSVSFGGVEAKFVVVSTTEITATVADGASGPITVVTDVSPTTFTNPPFTYIPPVVSSVPPSTQATSSAPEKKKISNDMLKKMLVKVVNNEWHADNFNQYFCSGTNTLVFVNNNNKSTSFAEFCQSIQGQKIEIESAQIIPDPSNPDCEMNLKITYKKNGEGFIKRILKGKG